MDKAIKTIVECAVVGTGSGIVTILVMRIVSWAADYQMSSESMVTAGLATAGIFVSTYLLNNMRSAADGRTKS